MGRLIHQEPLAAQFRDHPLKGGFAGLRECHLAPDWLLVYRIAEGAIIFERMGSHSDLFDE